MKHRMASYLLLVLLMLTSGTAYGFSNVTRYVFIDFLDFKKIQNNLYVSEHISSGEHQNIQTLIQNARFRITEHYGKPEANPVIIVIGNQQEAEDYGLYDTPGSLFFMPWQNYLVLHYPKCGVDVASHELVHAEMVDRLGYFKRQEEIPTWFDEGVALQVDFRQNYRINLDQFEKSEILRVRTLDSPEKFWSEDKQQNMRNYQAAKAAVAMVFESLSKKELYSVLAGIKEGDKFAKTFNLVEAPENP